MQGYPCLSDYIYARGEEMTDRFKFEAIDKLTDRYFLETKNPLLWLFLKLTNRPTTKTEMKLLLIKEELYES